MAVIAQEEREMISARTKAALAAAKARGVKLGGLRANQRKMDPAVARAALQAQADEFATSVGPVIAELRDAGMSLGRIPLLEAAGDAQGHAERPGFACDRSRRSDRR
jgi:DNA invertase Pin-like site-specific DNA recombinase